jgi:2'-5' RNA ligase
MRLFIAAELPEGILEALAETSALLRGCVRGRFVAPDSFHVTLAFLGDVAEHRVNDLCKALDRACDDTAAFDVSLGDFGCFGKRSKATLWQGFREAGALPELAQAVRRELRQADFSFDDKKFLPHVTLMRAANLTAGELPMPALAEGPVSEITLFQSDLSGKRPVYKPIHVVTLY